MRKMSFEKRYSDCEWARRESEIKNKTVKNHEQKKMKEKKLNQLNIQQLILQFLRLITHNLNLFKVLKIIWFKSSDKQTWKIKRNMSK